MREVRLFGREGPRGLQVGLNVLKVNTNKEEMKRLGNLIEEVLVKSFPGIGIKKTPRFLQICQRGSWKASGN